ncbi:DUF6268 family outer membrane beta-barrel protein [Aquimarina sp. 2201CG5-10]|uniref:DUF6268 family outer membrane beta-barrel protein n=1 Tax=Aquimarina callyspongiae TaxID=3098150 RepID=UPI002AB4B328|nr:DUF6268 family outer membrane beta-barrel protein [Aquimarina sp. 2201CG5-10]MDY8136604.1 DUF6268 family outer membrane beta-barrel protein [Aquimarina sp. 2201CG5-10]
MKIQQKQNSLILLLLMYCIYSYGQQQDDISTRLSHTLEGDSDANIFNFDFTAKLYSKPLKNGRGQFRVDVTSNYSNIDYNTPVLFEEDLDKFYNFGISLTYFKVLNRKWSFVGILRPQLSSNFTSDITYDDFNPNAIILFNYITKPVNRLTFGVAYNPYAGIGVPIIPIANYWKKFNEKTEMNIGFPETSFTYNISPKTSLKALAKFEGFNYNISENFNLNNEEVERINYNEIITGLELKQKLSNTINITLNTGYTVNRTFEFTDTSGDKISGFDMENNFNISLGLGFKLDAKKKK